MNSADSPPPIASTRSEESSSQLEKIQSKLKLGSGATKKATSKADEDHQENQDHQLDSDEEKREAEQKKL